MNKYICSLIVFIVCLTPGGWYVDRCFARGEGILASQGMHILNSRLYSLTKLSTVRYIIIVH